MVTAMASDRDTAAAGGPERVLERMSYRYLELDPSCRVVDSNAAGRELLIAAAGPSDVRGRDLRDLLTGYDDRRVTEALHRAVETGTASTVVATLVRPDGRFEFRVCPENEGVSLYVPPIPSETTGPGVMQRQTTVISDLYEAFNDPAADLDGKVASLLAIGRAALDTEYGTLSRVDDDRPSTARRTGRCASTTATRATGRSPSGRPATSTSWGCS